MTSVIKWCTGEPTEFGWYLTVRKNRKTGSMKVSHNQYIPDELIRNGKLPCTQGWQVRMHDYCDIVAWCKVDDIEIMEQKIIKQ